MSRCGCIRRRWGGLSGNSGRSGAPPPLREEEGDDTDRLLPTQWGGGPRSGGGVSAYLPLHGGSSDEIHDAVQMQPDILGSDPDDPDLTLTQPGGPPTVVLDAIRMFVTLPIHLHGQLRCWAVEVQDVRPDRMLPAKLEPTQPFAAKANP